MTKISVETYIEAVECYLTGNESKARVRDRYGIANRNFQIIVTICEQHGRKGLIAPPKVTGEFRVNLVEWRQEHHVSLTETCAHFAFRSIASIGIWERIYFTEGKQALLALRQGVKPHRPRKCTTTTETSGKREFIVADTERRFKKIGSLEKVTNRQISEVIKDLYSNRILEWEISTHPTLFSLAPLERLAVVLPYKGYQFTLHTDQGWQYQHRAWHQLLHEGRIRQSMSHRSTCLDNAACETVFNKLKAEMTPVKDCADANILMTTITE